MYVTGAGSRFDVVGGAMDVGGTSGRGMLYVGPGGSASVDSGRGPLHVQPGGQILGQGTVRATVINYGAITPGGSIGLLTIDGRLEQPAGFGGTLRFDLGSAVRGTGYDAINVTGRVDLQGGKVVLNFVGGFAPAAGQQFRLVHADSQLAPDVTHGVEVRGLAPGFRYTLEARGTDVVLTALNDGVAAAQQVPVVGVLANDTDADGDALSAVLVERPRHGTLTLYRDGSFAYVPDFSFAGTDSFTYRADDGVFTSAPATVTIRNLPPVAKDDAYAVDQNKQLTVPLADGVLENDADTVSPTLAASLVRSPAHGTLTLNSDGSFAYTPAVGFSGTDTFTYRASDGQLQSEPATVTITVRQVNSAPVAIADHKSVQQDKDLVFDASDLLANDTDADGDTLTLTGVSSTASTHGTVSLANGKVTYRPDRHFSGAANFTYTISDGHGGSASGTVNVTVLSKKRGNAGMAVGAGTVGSGRRQFTFAVSARGAGDDLAIRGTVMFRDVARRVNLRATDIDLFDINSDGSTVTIGGTASLNGRDGYRFELTAQDRSRSGSNDRFRIRITGPDNFTYDSGSADRIDRGNVQVLPSKRKND